MKKKNRKNRKNGKNGKRRSGEEEEDITSDRLSSLPEPILHHILSFLDTKSAVQTSVLSRSLNRAWKHVAVLDLSCLSFQQYASFRRFVSQVLSLRYNLNLHKVSYMDDDQYKGDDEDFYDEAECRDVRICVEVIKYALSHDAQHLVINLDNQFTEIDGMDRFSNLFGTILNCSLKTLELRNICIDDGLGSCGFGMLTTLSLEDCTLASDQHGGFFSNFPSLNNLALRWCEPWDSNSTGDAGLKISAPQLLSLYLFGTTFSKMELFAPRLKFFTLVHGLSSLESTKLSFPSLDHVAISVSDFDNYDDGWYLEDNRECGAQRFISLFQGLNNATSLVLDDSTIKALSKISEFLESQPSPFTRLKSLIMGAHCVPDKLVDYFLKGSSCMETKVESTWWRYFKPF